MSIKDPARWLGPALAALLCAATASLVWLGYRATREWQRSTALLTEQRAEAMLALLSGALSRDMKGAHVSVLLPLDGDALAADPPYDLRDSFARAFARFPYPESFFAWKATASGEGNTWFFHRSDRPPAWDDPTPGPYYPVTMVRDPPAARDLVARARGHAEHGRRFAVFETELAGRPYQVVVQLLYGDGVPSRLVGFVGFTTSLTWIRERYFLDLTREIARIGGETSAASLAILDETGATVAATGSLPAGTAVRDRPFTLLFYDPAMTSMLSPDRPPVRQWTARVGAADGEALAAAGRGARRTLFLLSLAALATVVGVVTAVQAARASASLAAMKSEFVATVTHELKTPLAVIQLAAETLALGRYSSPTTLADYTRMLSRETRRLSRLIDNLLAYARLSDVRGGYTFQALEVADVVEETLDHFRPRLLDLGFAVDVDLPLDLPRVRADRVALLQLLENLVENAILYSPEARVIAIHASAREDRVRLEVKDRGQGIPQAELPHVFDKFFRGRAARAGGTGLGLAIVQRIAHDHQGKVFLESREGEGTTVAIELPVEAAS